jgi:hypothetical protein
MRTATRTKRSELTPYEEEQVRRIAVWKSEPPNPLSELWKMITLPVAHAIERLIPDRVVRAAIMKSYDVSDLLDGQRSIKRRAAIQDLAELKHKPLEDCDALAIEIGARAEALAAVEGAATGAGGMLTTLLDVPILFILGLGTIRKVGHCYGYPLDGHRDRHFVLGILMAAMAGSLEIRRQRVHQLRELEDLLLEETQVEVVTEEAISFLFQLEIFEEIPGVGMISGSVLNWLSMRRVEETARMVFQERWLRDNGKVQHIEPAEAPARHLAGGWAGALNRAAYSGCYTVAFSVTLPYYAAAALFRPMDNALARGLRDAATAAIDQIEQLTAGLRGGASARLVPNRKTTPALARG